MTIDEFCALLKRVKRLGGPVGRAPFPYTDHVMIGKEGVGYAGWVLQHKPLEDHMVGVLKRDLTERGNRIDLILNGASSDKALVYVTHATRHTANTYVGRGDSELAALLRVWIAAVEAQK